MGWFRHDVGTQDGRRSLHRSYGSSCLRERRRVWPPDSRWIFDPPEWTSVIYFPTVVKMIWGPKHVRSFAYVTAYGALVMSLICLVQSLVGSLT